MVHPRPDSRQRERRAAGRRAAVRINAGPIIITAVILAAIFGAYVLAVTQAKHAVAHSNQQWCGVVRLLTMHNPPPATARAKAIADALAARSKTLGCG